MMISLVVHGIAAFLLGMLFKVTIIFPLIAFVSVEALLMALLGFEGAGAFLLWALCITQGCYAMGIAARAASAHLAARRQDGVRRGSAAPDRSE